MSGTQDQDLQTRPNPESSASEGKSPFADVFGESTISKGNTEEDWRRILAKLNGED